ncbi:hypothetical protein NWP96_06220 [Mycoplasmopsis cynos]|nr:hypothetical protein [Mycoplasmopsis cynos]
MQTETLSELSKKLGLIKLLRTGPGQMYYEVTGSMKVQADVFEAILGAIFIDQGLLKAKEFVQKHLLSQISNKSLVISDHKDQKQNYKNIFKVLVEKISHILLKKRKIRLLKRKQYIIKIFMESG